jgi:hypothetical protein
MTLSAGTGLTPFAEVELGSSRKMGPALRCGSQTPYPYLKSG